LFSNSPHWLCMAAALLLTACQPDIDQVKLGEVQRHKNGLLMPLPNGFVATPTPYGFKASPTTQLRSPLEFHVRLTRGPLPSDISRKYFGLFGPYEHVVSGEATGSSGAETSLQFWRQVGNCWIVLTARQMSEHTTPSFLEARAAAEKSSAAATSGC
jgi:hypothetical protein